MRGDLIIGFTETPTGIECRGAAVCPQGIIRYRHFEPYPQPVSGIFGDIANAVKKGVKAIAKNKVVRGLVNTAMTVAKATPYGAAAAAALDVAKGVVNAARGGGRKGGARPRARGGAPSTSRRPVPVRRPTTPRRAPSRPAPRAAVRVAPRTRGAARPLPSASQLAALRPLLSQVPQAARAELLEKLLGLA